MGILRWPSADATRFMMGAIVSGNKFATFIWPICPDRLSVLFAVEPKDQLLSIWADAGTGLHGTGNGRQADWPAH
ncbi:MAG: hypothetical protein R8G34_00425 [Paracoccaceae bacterium]|nr:hypothetical protein [Paracoccaceae bacterium]